MDRRGGAVRRRSDVCISDRRDRTRLGRTSATMWKPVGQRSRPGSACSPVIPTGWDRGVATLTQPIIDFLTLGTRTASSAGSPPMAARLSPRCGSSSRATTSCSTPVPTRPRARRWRGILVVLTVDLEEPPYGFVQLQGVAEVTEELVEVRRIATLNGARYMGADRRGVRRSQRGARGARSAGSPQQGRCRPRHDRVGVTGPTPSVLVRDARPDDWAAIWPFLRVVISAGETFTWDRDTDDPAARRLWIADRPA